MNRRSENERGHTLVEMLVVAGILMVLAATAIPTLKAYSVEAHALGAGRVFKGIFRRAGSVAVRTNAQTAIRFEETADGAYYSVYADGNHNGVLSADIASGADPRLEGPYSLDAGAPGVRVGIIDGTPAIPPERGLLDTRDPIRFGRANMLSFSPLGTATPGTFYLAGEGIQVAVRVNGGTARVRLMVYRGQWRERS
ncbi:MAG: prepilin-type N-terminal cleavage/methylation domain-containing protein [Acidobacteria bacterium]|nr:prepilin-type N-terminal cleavage/methylation domain-containing protein [Acidobacteriota bacterium]